MKRDRKTVEDRQTNILARIRECQEVRVDDLAELFDVSVMTIRRDLQCLEDAGLIERIYGAARALSSDADRIFKERVRLSKDAIARYAAHFVEANDSIFINGSTTALAMLDYITAEGVRVYTNNCLACHGEYPSNLRVIILGGKLQNANVMAGDFTVRNLLETQVNKAFLGCTGISSSGELLCDIPIELVINELMVQHSQEYFVLADHTKIGIADNYASWHLEKCGTIVTDSYAPQDVVKQLESIGMQVLTVETGHL